MIDDLLSMHVRCSDVKFMQCNHTAAKVGSRLDLAPDTYLTFPCGLEAGPPRLLPSGAISAAVENQSSLIPL